MTYPGQLRQDPKRTQMYQPDTLPARARNLRATDSPSTPTIPPQPQAHPSGGLEDPRHPAFDWYENYKPKPSIALTLRPHLTPGNNPTEFHSRKILLKAQSQPRPPENQQQHLRPFLQNQMNGPNIYQRCLLGLRSGIEDEQTFALHHLVKVSHERGDKYKFEGFILLAEALLEKALEITKLVYGVKWDITYNEDDGTAPSNTLNGAFGTPNLLERIQSFKPLVEDELLETDGSIERLERLKEAALVLRNMVILDENALFISRMPLFKDFLAIAVSLPNQPRLAEFRHSALEVAQYVTQHWPILPTDPLYRSLIPHLESSDRGVLLLALRSINRMGMATQDFHRLYDIPLSTVERLFSLLTLETDVELLGTTLTFLYEFTATPENNTELLSSRPHLIPSVIPRLINLLSHQASVTIENVLAAPQPEKMPIPAVIPIIPPDLHAQLLVLPEPERSSKWLRCCFEESPTDDITQIAIWQAYQNRFSASNPIPAADFIKNVSSTFSTAQAQVINGPTPRFIIKGIKPRRVLVDTDRKLRYFKCLWKFGHLDPADPAARNAAKNNVCGQWCSSRESLWLHVLGEHLQMPRAANGGFVVSTPGSWTCRWELCTRDRPLTKATDMSSHIRVHIPKSPEDVSEIVHELANVGKKPERIGTKHAYQYTMMDQTNHPAGVPWMSVLILRNLARYANKPDAKRFEKNGVSLADQLFGGHKYALFNIMGVSRTLRESVVDLVYMIEEGERAEKRGVKRDHESDDREVTAY